MLGRTRAVISGALLALAVAAPAAQAVDTDQWARWVNSPRDSTIRSLDWAGAYYAASESDGVFWSANPLGPWQAMSGGLSPQLAADDVRQVKQAPNGLLYAATSAGLYSAQPAGSWSPVGQGTGADKLNMGGIQAVMFNDPSGADMTVAVAGAAGPGVYNSSNGGSTWKRASGMPAGENIYHLTSPPLVSTPMYAAGDSGVWVSANLGRSWILMADGLPAGETTLRVAVSPADPTRLYAGTSSSVFRFNPHPAKLRWEEIEVRGAPAAGGDHKVPGGAKMGMVVAPPVNGSPKDKRAVVGTSSGVWATVDDGATWGQMSAATAGIGEPQMGDEVVWTLALAPGTLMAGSGHGVFTLPLQPLQLSGVTISGAATRVPGTKMTATPLGLGGSKPFFLAYQWYTCNSAGCDPDSSESNKIDGATSSTFVIPEEHENQANRRYGVRLVGKNVVSPNDITVYALPTTAGVGATPAAAPEPISGQLPSLTPTSNAMQNPTQGTVFTAHPGAWKRADGGVINPALFSVDYKWQRCPLSGTGCEDIPDADGAAYTATTADIAKKLYAYVRGNHGSASSQWYLAGITNLIQNKMPVNAIAPRVIGEPYVGRTLSSSVGEWDGYDMVYKRRWFRCEADGLGCNPMVPEHTASTYTATAADLGKRLAVEIEVIAHDETFDRKTKLMSAPSAVIANPPVPGGGGSTTPPPPGGGGGGGLVSAPTVKISAPRKLRPGVRIRVPKAYTGFANPRYKWLRNGKKIKRATKRVYTLTRKDRGKRIACRITLTRVADGAKVVVRTKALKVPRKRG